MFRHRPPLPRGGRGEERKRVAKLLAALRNSKVHPVFREKYSRVYKIRATSSDDDTSNFRKSNNSKKTE